MALETGSRIADLVPTNPVGATDFVSQGDDHLRLVKACIQGSFPSLGATAVTMTGAELNGIKDASNLTSGTLPDGRFPATLPAVSGVNLTALDATNIGSGTLADARLSSNIPRKDAAATITGTYTFSTAPVLPAGSIADASLSSNVPLKNAANAFTGAMTITVASSTPQVWARSGGAEVGIQLGLTTGYIGTITDHPFVIYVNNSDRVSVDDGMQIGAPTGGDKGAGTLNTAGAIYQNNVPVSSLPAVTSTSTTLVAGQAHYITGNATLPALTAGEWVSIINNSGSSITISESSGYTTYWTASGASVSSFTLPARGRLFAEGIGSSTAYVSGDISAAS